MLPYSRRPAESLKIFSASAQSCGESSASALSVVPRLDQRGQRHRRASAASIARSSRRSVRRAPTDVADIAAPREILFGLGVVLHGLEKLTGDSSALIARAT
jgi:hypothetical protein